MKIEPKNLFKKKRKEKKNTLTKRFFVSCGCSCSHVLLLFLMHNMLQGFVDKQLTNKKLAESSVQLEILLFHKLIGFCSLSI